MQTDLVEKITFLTFRENGVSYDLGTWLEKDVPGPITGDCNPAWAVFYFRVNGKGEVDSLFVRERLRRDVSEKIVKNIYETKGHWQLSQHAKATDSAWYIFPYFDLGVAPGANPDCSEKDRELQQIVKNLIYTMAGIQVATQNFNATQLKPSINGGGIIKM